MKNLKLNRLRKPKMKKGLKIQKMRIIVEDTEALKDTRGQTHVMIEGKLTQKKAGHAHQDAEVDHQNISQTVVINTEITHQVAASLAIVTTNVMSTGTAIVMTTERATIDRVAAVITTIIDVGESVPIDKLV